MRRPGFAVHAALLMACISLFTTFAHAQYRTSIQGVVTDATGAVVPGASLTLVNLATNEKQTRVSDPAGVYNFNALPAGANFRLEVQKDGFQKKVLDHLGLIPDQPNAVTVQLEVGTTAQTITVNAEGAPLLDTETASINGVVSANQVQHMPSFGRDVLKLAQLSPGVFGDGSQGIGGGGFNLPGTETGGGASGGDAGIFNTENGAPISANGGQTPSNGVTIDGISTTSSVWGGTTIITPSEDSIESFKVVSNDYDAEYGRFSGAQIQITSKSGTNQYHGSAFFTAHRPGLNAFQPFNGAGNSDVRDQSRFNQIGGSVGGPIIKNKVFAFFSYETIREHTNTLGNQWADTAAFDALALSGSIASTLVNFPGNGIVNKGVNNVSCQNAGLVEGVNCHAVTGGLNIGTPLDPVLFPLGQIGSSAGFPSGGMDPGWTSSSNPGTGGDGSGGPENLGIIPDIANYITSNPTTKTDVQYNGRLDYDLTQKDRIGFAIYWVPQTNNFDNGNRALDVFHHNQVNYAYSPIWNHTFSPTFLNEIRANAAGWRWNEITSNPQSPVGLPNAGFDFSIGGANINDFGPNVGSHLDQWTYSFKDVATKIIGSHTIKFGLDLTRLSYLNACFGCSIPSYGFFNMWDFLNDAPRREGFVLADPTTGALTAERQDDRENIFGFFAQDNFKLRKNLTLNLGLRWSYFGPLYSKENNMFVAHPGAGSNYLSDLTVGKGNSWNAQKNNFSPEIGFAWTPGMFHEKLVVRGGYGLNYNQEEIAISANVQGNPGLSIGEYLQMGSPTSANVGILYSVSSSPSNPYGYPANPAFQFTIGSNGLPQQGTAQCPTTCPAGVIIMPSTLPTMRVHHYSLDTEYDLGHRLMASLGYQGSVSHDVLFDENPLALPAALGYTVNQNQINGGNFWSASGRANYNAMLAELKHDFSQQFMADAQFTWAKGLDNTSRPYTEPYYPFDPNLSYGRTDYNVAKAFKLFGMWQPIFFHGSKGWIEKVAGGWSLSGIFNLHSGFPWSPLYSFANSLYCADCGYSTVYPSAYLGGAGSSTSNDKFKFPAASNFPIAPTGGVSPYFSVPIPTTYTCPTSTTCQYGTANAPAPGVRRNSLNLPGYRAIDMTLTKGFGLPNMPVLGENARLEFRLDVYNLFNNLNLDPTQIQNNIDNSNFGTITQGLAGRTATMGLRFSF